MKRRIVIEVDSGHVFDMLAQHPDLQSALGDRLVSLMLVRNGVLDDVGLSAYGIKVAEESSDKPFDWSCKPPEIPSVSRTISYLRDFGPGTTDTTDRYMMRWAADHLANLESRANHWQRIAEAQRPLEPEFAEELRERLLSLAEDPDLKRRHTHLNGEIRTFASIVKIAANVLGRPLPAPAEARSEQVSWALVPREPTPEMVGAFWRVKNGHHFADEPPPTDTSDYAAYRAMVAAAPSPPKADADHG